MRHKISVYDTDSETYSTMDVFSDDAQSWVRPALEGLAKAYGLRVEDCRLMPRNYKSLWAKADDAGESFFIDHVNIGMFAEMSLLYSVASTPEELAVDGRCKTCGGPTRFIRTALICDKHGLVGGF